jgi:hypothetical protein
MSEIPFVNALGDEIEHKAAARLAGRRGRIRRRLTFGALGFAVAATGVAAASGILSGTPEQLATTGIGCYEKASLNANVSVLSTGQATPIETCRRVLGTDAPLVACAGEAVLVFPGTKGTCARLGLKPLPTSYAAVRRRVNRLAERIMALERSVDCLPPEELAARVQTLLDRSPAWRGWRTRLQAEMEEGPCGTVSQLNGDGSRSADGAFDATNRVVLVTPSPSRSTMDLVYAPDGPASSSPPASAATTWRDSRRSSAATSRAT